MPILYRVRNWSEHFENNRSREVKDLQWVPIPNKHDGDGYTELMSHGPAAAAHLGAFVLIVQVASKCNPRGTLMRDGGRPHDCDSLSRLTRCDAEAFDNAIPLLCSIGWLEWKGDTEEWFTYCIAPQCGNPAPSRAVTAPSCIEENGKKEGNGMGESEVAPTVAPRRPRKREPFVPPAVEEVQAHLDAIGERRFTGKAFVASYASQGWTKKGGAPVVDWKQCVVTWQENEKKKFTMFPMPAKMTQPDTEVNDFTVEENFCIVCGEYKWVNKYGACNPCQKEYDSGNKTGGHDEEEGC